MMLGKIHLAAKKGTVKVMRIKPSELEAQGYTLLDALNHTELAPFVRKYLNQYTRTAVFYYAVNVLFFAWAVFSMFQARGAGWDDRIVHFCYGFALAFCLVPLHEFLHVLAYRSQGARHTSYGADWRKLIFMAIADQFVANRKEFRVIGLTPFVVISMLMIGLVLAAAPLWRITAAGVLFAHTAMCSGDFGLLSYFEYYKHRDVVTYDDPANGISYFYAKST
ncbi:MAG: DUF3267 domain-containing protein [Bacteroidetes bacterium]|nr:DUF3267 domain-containing protein [Bacteroidota bacterium]